MTRLAHWVEGKPWEGSSPRSGDVFDPASGVVRAAVALATAEDVDHAVGTAADAFEEWRATPLGRRVEILFAFRELVDRHRRDLAERIVGEHGKVLADALGEVQRGLEVVEFACGLPHLLKGATTEGVSSGVDSHSVLQPLGVCAGITPFNFPVMVPMWMHPLAIACGNTFVLKPSERTPGASQLVAELWAAAGLPAGVFTVVHGDREAVDALLAHPLVAAVSFVGSTPVARHVYAAAAAAGKRVQALGGAKNHMVVLPDADIAVAADAATGAGYGSAGERCMAVSVVVAAAEIANELVAAIADRTAELRVAPGMDPGAQMGPLITRTHRDRVASYLDRAADEGAEIVVDGRGLALPGHGGGFWLGPSLVDRVTPAMQVYRDEVFGPVLCVVRSADLDDALALVNANPHGNGAAVFTRDGAAAQRFAAAVEAGMVGLNVPIPVPMAYHSFGGWKDSRFGDAPMHGMAGVRFYSRLKTVTSRWPDLPQGPELAFRRDRR